MKINVIKKERKIILDNKWIIGGVVLDTRCYECKNNLLYFDKYDSDFCPECNIWVSPTCEDDNCPYCKKRPQTPLHEFYD